MSDDRRPVIAVIGGGIAGLAAAWELATGDDAHAGTGSPAVVIIDAGDRPGGKLRSQQFAGRVVDLAPDAFLARRPEATELCEELGITDELVPVGASGAAVLAKGQLRQLPEGLNLGVPTRWLPLAGSGILTWRQLAGVAKDLVLPRHFEAVIGDRAVADIVTERLGRPIVDRLVDPLVGGIHAGGVDDLSTAATFPALLTASQQPGSLMRRLRPSSPGSATTPAAGSTVPTSASSKAPVFWSLRSGTASLADRLVDRLSTRSVEFVSQSSVETLARAGGGWRLTITGPTHGDHQGVGGRSTNDLVVDGVVLAVPAPEAGTLLAPHTPVASELLHSVEYASVGVITLAIRREAIGVPLTGTGFLVPRTSTINNKTPLMTGCTYLSVKWPHLDRPEDVLLRVSVGRFGDTRADQLSDTALTEAVIAELRPLLRLSATPTESTVTRWPDAFPQYRVGHLIKVAMIEDDVATQGALAVAGAALRGVGIPACIGSGRAAARAVLRSLRSPSTSEPGSTSGSAGTDPTST